MGLLSSLSDDAAKATAESAPLIAQHNIKPQGLLFAQDIGGLPMPSMAVSNVNYPLENFGGITLLGDSSMITPSRNVSTYAGDIYSGRQPRGDFEITSSPKQIVENLKSDPSFSHLDLNRIFSLGDMYGGWGKSKDEVVNEVIQKLQAGKEAGVNPKDYEDLKSFYAAAKDIPESSYINMGGVNDYGTAEYRLYPSDRYTSSGNLKRPQRYTAENALKMMQKEKAQLAGAEAQIGSAGQAQGVLRPSFGSLGDIQSARGLLTNNMNPIKDAFEEAYNESLFNVIERLHVSREKAANLIDDLSTGKSVSWANISSSDKSYIKSEIDGLRKAVSKMPAEYFESKLNRIVKPREFSAAVVPSADNRSADLLKQYGVDVYPVGANETRQQVIEKAAREKGLLFSNPLATGAAGSAGLSSAMMPSESEAAAIAELKALEDQYKPSMAQKAIGGVYDTVMTGLDLPARGVMGLTRLPAGLLAGESLSDAYRAAQQQYIQDSGIGSENIGEAIHSKTGNEDAGTAAYIASLLLSGGLL